MRIGLKAVNRSSRSRWMEVPKVHNEVEIYSKFAPWFRVEKGVVSCKIHMKKASRTANEELCGKKYLPSQL